jgi:hypothetical protein
MARHGVTRAKTEGNVVTAGGVTREAIRWIIIIGIILFVLSSNPVLCCSA